MAYEGERRQGWYGSKDPLACFCGVSKVGGKFGVARVQGTDCSTSLSVNSSNYFSGLQEVCEVVCYVGGYQIQGLLVALIIKITDHPPISRSLCNVNMIVSIPAPT